MKNSIKKLIQNFKLQATSYKLQADHAFTLIEILVASAIFTAIVVLAIGSFSGSINFQGTSTDDRITRQSISDFNEWMTRQVRSVAANKINIAANRHCLINDLVTGSPCISTPATEDYLGFGYLLFGSFDANGYYRVSYPASSAGVKNIILPRTSGGWVYISGTTCAAGDILPVIKVSNSTQPNDLDINNPCGGQWTNAGQVMSSEVLVKDLTFYGVNPSSLFKANVATAGYPALVQPYVTWRMQVAPVSDSTNVSSYQTTLTSRDYSYIYPSIGN
jgi:prepilin-type N-terminal cleavage/methylation domain-containing protein